MESPTHLKSLQAVEMALRMGSMTKAAQVLSITPAALGQRVKVLEDYLGISLFGRGRSGLIVSAELAAALPHLKLAFAELEEAARELDLQRGQELHIAAPSDFAELWLKPRLGEFRKLLPNMRICLNGVGDAPMRLGKGDCTIAYGPPLASQSTEVLINDYAVPICSRANLERTAALPAATRLEGFPLLHVDFYKDDPARISWAEWIAHNHVQRTAPERGIRFRRIIDTLNAVAADAGLALCGIALLETEIAAGRIKFPCGLDGGIWSSWGFVASFPERSQARPLVRRFREWLVSESIATSTWLESVTSKPRL
ncbi:LysR family transcriptional regulator [Erythrobacter vulgaris]|uniref:LysR family transcriptional regulator n=1 Tax=Qipengyuania vulgaris TaxID=291985 RepID=A0A844XR71_9SPHN|nr:LysR substrate-binding domain-containing protein [Qipengyuania vulgaris]MXO48635.1 LysR family transcriptional regulator [Qipengyuania vulgaris]